MGSCLRILLLLGRKKKSFESCPEKKTRRGHFYLPSFREGVTSMCWLCDSVAPKCTHILAELEHKAVASSRKHPEDDESYLWDIWEELGCKTCIQEDEPEPTPTAPREAREGSGSLNDCRYDHFQPSFRPRNRKHLVSMAPNSPHNCRLLRCRSQGGKTSPGSGDNAGSRPRQVSTTSRSCSA